MVTKLRATSLVLVFVLGLTSCGSLRNMKTQYAWKTADYDFPKNNPRESYLASGQYSPPDIIILDASVWEGPHHAEKVFVTTPRLRNGTPATLSVVTSKTRNNAPLLAPYPDWSWHRQGDCNGMISVFRTAVDECDRLWVTDTGYSHAENKRVCPPQILAFDLHTNKLLGRYVFPKNMYERKSLFITTKIDTRGQKCSDTFAYIADVTEFKLVVFNANEQRSWKIESNYFYPDPLQGVFNINGVQFDLMDGIFGITLGPLINKNRMLYFHALASVHESWVHTCVIRNQSLFENEVNLSPRSFKISQGTRSSQSAAEDMTEDGILFFPLISDNALACWNSRLPYDSSNIEIVEQDDERLQFASGLKVYKHKVWVTTSRFQNYFTNIMNPNETNFRISVGRVDDLVRGTTCEMPPGGAGSPPHHHSYKPKPPRPPPGSSYQPLVFENN
ncbi:hypothetical protein LSTR_LSTR011398 [Laodelphax striatellus]|uniref:Bee-milk protein n=1 Tax=Laodelphax striatellus TaxID=195883 RepID=A0A482XT64_LAOST|nr:hypothetical protein LSTR_LSTR011398 [Laodelphax striatellus]